MKKNHVIILVLSIAIVAVVLYFQLRGDKKTDNLAPGVHQVKAKEVIQTSNYTYINVSEDGKDYWCAINRTEISVGQTYYWLKGWEMNKFRSKELNREFASIFFLETLSENPILAGNLHSDGGPASEGSMGRNPLAGASMAGRQKVAEKPGISVTKAEGGITIAELYAGRASYNGKSVKIRAEVVKFSPDIMNRNWMHIQDGTRDGDEYDLAVTTHDSIPVGETRVFEGVVSQNVDFGSGYKYEVIMLDARAK